MQLLFAFGMVLADYCFEKKEFPEFRKTWLSLIAVILIGIDATILLRGPVWIKSFNDFFASIGLFSFILLLYQIIPLKREIIFLSQFSYEFYLLHVLILYAVIYFAGNSVINGIVAFTFSLALAYLFHKSVAFAEKK